MVPIMGSNIPKTDWGDQALFQWSKGEYTSATQKQDDLRHHHQESSLST